jgi:cell fate regulator YaaT (PSP1 superfamily)
VILQNVNNNLSSMTAEQGCPPNRAADTQKQSKSLYHIRFREQGQEHLARSLLRDLVPGDGVLVRLDDERIEPARIVSRTPLLIPLRGAGEEGLHVVIQERIQEEDWQRYQQLPVWEQEALVLCKQRIKVLNLPMHLVRVERYFNASKAIFYFTAESRVDFRELVKDLVQAFRTRVEMRQIGVRHETQMTGGIGACGRELCCTSFLRNFESVSIKMAKVQELPLNPAKISGLCNRLLCCLTYEFDNYRSIKRDMPRVGRHLLHEEVEYRVTRIFPLQGTVQAVSSNGAEVLLTEEQWRTAKSLVPKPPAPVQKKIKNKPGGKKNPAQVPPAKDKKK